MSDEISITVRDVSRVFKRYRHPRYRVLEALGFPLPKNAYDEFWALHGISLAVRRGESLAIIGQNGAGKSTLLSIVCGRLQPSSGSVSVRGEIQALMDLGTGFHPEFTGRQNIYSALSYQGITGRAADDRLDEIVDFSELAEFIDQPIKTYSSGMYARLAFSAATAIVPDVLIIDEILAAGDAYFAGKCADRMRRLTKEAGATVLFVSHDMASVQHLCEQAVWLERGRIKMAGPTLEISKAYYASVMEREEARLRAQTSRAVSRMRRREGLSGGSGEQELLTFRLVAASGRLPALRHPVHRAALVFADGSRLQVSPGEASDNDAAQTAYIQTDPGYMIWGRRTVIGGRAARCLEDTGGAYAHAPIFFRVPPEIGDASPTIEIEHAAADGEAISIEVHEPGGYRSIGLLTPAEHPNTSRIESFAVAQRADETADRASVHDNWGTAEARFLDIIVCSDSAASQHVFGFAEAITFKIVAELRIAVPVCWLAAIIYDYRGNRISLAVHQFDRGLQTGRHELSLRIDRPNLRQGDYVVTIELLPDFDFNWKGDVRLPYLCHWDRSAHFKIDEDYHGSIELGLVALPVSVTARRLPSRHEHHDGRRLTPAAV